MKDRCFRPTNKAYHNYGGRGIRVCDRWLKFENFFADMGEPPKGKSLDRIDNNGNYEPNNCRWATQREQCNNTRVCVKIAHEGETLTVTQWSARSPVSRRSFRDRIKNGWPIELALNAPANPRRKTFGEQRKRVPLVHGMRGYWNGCRCEICLTANRKYQQEWAANRAA